MRAAAIQTLPAWLSDCVVFVFVFLLWLHLTVRQPEKPFASQRPWRGRKRERARGRERDVSSELSCTSFRVAFSIAITQNESQQLNFGRQTDRQTVKQSDSEIVQRVPDNLLEILSYMVFLNINSASLLTLTLWAELFNSWHLWNCLPASVRRQFKQLP